MRRFAAAFPAAALLAGCFGTPQGLPVDVSICSAVPRAGGFDIVAAVRNRSTKPISRVDVSASFYQSFRYRTFSAAALLKSELDPGERRRLTFAVTGILGLAPQGQAIRCYATHIGYLDGTSADAPANQ